MGDQTRNYNKGDGPSSVALTPAFSKYGPPQHQSGKIIEIGHENWTPSKGHYIAIETDDVDPAKYDGVNHKLIIVYMHMREAPHNNDVAWVENTRIEKGQMVGRIGNSGLTDPDGNRFHMHFQVSRTGAFSPDFDLGNYVNPLHFYPTVMFTANKANDLRVYYK